MKTYKQTDMMAVDFSVQHLPLWELMEPLTEVCVYCMASREASPMKRCPSCDELPPSEVTEGDFRMMTEDEQNEYLKESN